MKPATAEWLFLSSSGSRISSGTESKQSTAPSSRPSPKRTFKMSTKAFFPIKVNQLREVVEEIMDAGRPFNFGLEAGSKPELIAALAVHRDPDSLIICNGYKDSTFIQNALLGRKLGKQVIMVVEKLEEVRQILQISREMNVMPLMGLRVRLQSKGSGKWATSGGENAKFGLSTADLIAASNYLKSQGMAESLVLVHFHVGSQVTDIGVIKRAVREAARFYAKLSKMGHPMQFVDVGGGLGVDYDGSRTAFDSSMNYTLQEYARDVVYNIIDVCDSEKVPHPDHCQRKWPRDRRTSFRPGGRGFRFNREGCSRSALGNQGDGPETFA